MRRGGSGPDLFTWLVGSLVSSPKGGVVTTHTSTPGGHRGAPRPHFRAIQCLKAALRRREGHERLVSFSAGLFCRPHSSVHSSLRPSLEKKKKKGGRADWSRRKGVEQKPRRRSFGFRCVKAALFSSFRLKPRHVIIPPHVTAIFVRPQLPFCGALLLPPLLQSLKLPELNRKQTPAANQLGGGWSLSQLMVGER